MNPKYWYNTTISTAGAFRADATFPLLLKATTIYKGDLHSFFSDTWLEYTKSVGFEFNRALLFFKPAHYKNDIAHIDMITGTEIAEVGFNFTVLGASGEMCWYEPNLEDQGKLLWSTSHSPYRSYVVTDLTLIEKTTIPKKTLTIVNTSIPHSVNVFSESRWCISLRGDGPLSRSWNEVISYSRSFNVLID